MRTTQAEPLTAKEGQLLFDMNLTPSTFAGDVAVIVTTDDRQAEQIKGISRKVNPQGAVICINREDTRL